MKTPMRNLFAALVLLSAFNLQPSTAFAQGTALTYQGRLNNNGSPAAGTYNLTFALFNTNITGVPIAGPVTNNAVFVTNGLFTVLIDFGPGVFTGAANWLQIGVATNGVSSFTILTPRQQLTPTPYAIYAESAGSLPALLVQPNTNGAPNLIGGSPVNFVSGGVVGATIAGGGAVNYAGDAFTNSVTADFGTVSGGRGSQASGQFATVGGGRGNQASGFVSTIAGGDGNTASLDDTFVGGGWGNSAANYDATVSGGDRNTAGGYATVVLGGEQNNAGGDYSTVGGGQNNNAAGAGDMLAGGFNNSSGGGNNSTISGGNNNNSSGSDAVIGGGQQNSVSAFFATIGGGVNNTATNDATVVAGGTNNVSGGFAASIGGGQDNTAAGNWATVSGGWRNLATGDSATVGGGYGNSAVDSATVAGGRVNAALDYVTTVAGGLGNQSLVYGSSVGGGLNNNADGYMATIPGGASNVVSGNYAFAAGFQAQATNGGAFVWADASGHPFNSTTTNEFSARATGGVRFVTAVNGSGNPTAGVALAPGATSWATLSDRNAKKDFAPVDIGAVLDKLAAVPVEQWHYKWEAADSTPNIGPMAQDFIHAFYPGRDDKSITTLEFDGVELAAIQGLNQKLDEKDAEIQDLKERLEKLEELINNKNGGRQ
jgi:hypothetical protein